MKRYRNLAEMESHVENSRRERWKDRDVGEREDMRRG